MHEPLSKADIAAINAADRFVSDGATDDRFVIDVGAQWFPNAARQLLAPKPGLVLHLQTDCGERNGHRYASGEVVVPSLIVRHLIRSTNGRPWLGAIMDGSDAPWWLELQHEADIGRRVLEITRRE